MCIVGGQEEGSTRSSIWLGPKGTSRSSSPIVDNVSEPSNLYISGLGWSHVTVPVIIWYDNNISDNGYMVTVIYIYITIPDKPSKSDWERRFMVSFTACLIFKLVSLKYIKKKKPIRQHIMVHRHTCTRSNKYFYIIHIIYIPIQVTGFDVALSSWIAARQQQKISREWLPVAHTHDVTHANIAPLHPFPFARATRMFLCVVFERLWT